MSQSVVDVKNIPLNSEHHSPLLKFVFSHLQRLLHQSIPSANWKSQVEVEFLVTRRLFSRHLPSLWLAVLVAKT